MFNKVLSSASELIEIHTIGQSLTMYGKNLLALPAAGVFTPRGFPAQHASQDDRGCRRPLALNKGHRQKSASWVRRQRGGRCILMTAYVFVSLCMYGPPNTTLTTLRGW